MSRDDAKSAGRRFDHHLDGLARHARNPGVSRIGQTYGERLAAAGRADMTRLPNCRRTPGSGPTRSKTAPKKRRIAGQLLSQDRYLVRALPVIELGTVAGHLLQAYHVSRGKCPNVLGNTPQIHGAVNPAPVLYVPRDDFHGPSYPRRRSPEKRLIAAYRVLESPHPTPYQMRQVTTTET